ncbi:EF-hand domain-containing protein [Marinicauda algicola]|nr:hypothetical protein [Marinicauda algicola]
MSLETLARPGAAGNHVAFAYRRAASILEVERASARLAALYTIACLVLGFLTGAALAVPAQAQVELSSARADLDGDGVITCDEAREARQTLLWAQDRNADASLEPAEFRAAAAGEFNWLSARIAFARLDADQDGRITRPELAAAPLVRFDQVDRDADCRLTEAELNAALDGEARR